MTVPEHPLEPRAGDADRGPVESPYERRKHDRTLEACGPGPFPRALELGAQNGLFSARLAERCGVLVTLELSPEAVDLARRRLAGLAGVTVLQGAVPDDVPDDEPFDLIVASEVLSRLSDDALRRTLDGLPRLLSAGGRLVAVHWSGQAPELARGAVETHRALRASGLRPVDLPPAPGPRGYLLDAFDMR
jgi:protein-L-isoaspartate O-methyltransferase